MILHPPVLASIGASALCGAVLTASAGFALRLLHGWDPDSGSTRQIALERTTHLVSTAVAFVLVVEAASLILFVFAADRMAALFVGAMCAVGTLQAGAFGFPTLWAKIVVFFAAFVWLVIDHVDGHTRDYALIRVKYAGLLVLAPLVLAEGGIELAYFLELKADTITSCCGKLFGEAETDLGGDLAALDPRPALALLFGGLATTIGLGLAAPRSRAVAMLHGPASLVLFAVALAAIVAAIAPYVYEQPHHHCPFCILKREYGHFGFALYVPLFVATGAATASATTAALARRGEAARAGAAAIGTLSRWAVAGHGLFASMALLAILRSSLTLI